MIVLQLEFGVGADVGVELVGDDVVVGVEGGEEGVGHPAVGVAVLRPLRVEVVGRPANYRFPCKSSYFTKALVEREGISTSEMFAIVRN